LQQLFSCLPKGEEADEERSRREALAILVAFMNHTDNKAEQQRIICKDDETIDYGNGTAFCKDPIMMVQDAGCRIKLWQWVFLDLKKWMKLHNSGARGP
jgi:hypothetical protein